MNTQICSKCNRELTFSEFYTEKAGKNGLRQNCKTCMSVYSKIRYASRADIRERMIKRQSDLRKNNPDVLKDQHTRRKYNVAETWYTETLLKQNGGCACCGTSTPGGNGSRFKVDHDHNTKQVRGLLCHGCNTGGKITDSPDLLLAKLKYLSQFGKHPS